MPPRVCLLLLLCVVTMAADPLLIDAGAIPLITRSATLYIDSFPLLEGAFGSKDGVPSDPIFISAIQFTGNPPVPMSGIFSNLFVDSLSVSKTSPSPTFAITWEDARTGGAAADTVISIPGASIPLIGTGFGFTLGTYAALPLTVHAMSLRGTSPLTVRYGPEPPSYFDVLLTIESSGDNLLLVERSAETSGGFWVAAGNRSFSSTGRLKFISSDMGTFERVIGLRSDAETGSFHAAPSRTVIPEPATFAVVLSGLALVALTAARNRRHARRRAILS